MSEREQQLAEKIAVVTGHRAKFVLETVQHGRTQHGKTSIIGAIWDALVERDEDRWMPFDSAPTDGTEILVWREDAGVFMASFRPSAGDAGEYGPQMNGPECWFDNYGCDLTGDLPTKWQSLPAAPERSQK